MNTVVTIFENAILRACCKVLVKGGGNTSRLAQWAAHYTDAGLSKASKFGGQEKFCYRDGKFSEHSGLFSEWPGENSAKVLCWLFFWVHQPSTGGLAEIITYQ